MTREEEKSEQPTIRSTTACLSSGLHVVSLRRGHTRRVGARLSRISAIQRLYGRAVESLFLFLFFFRNGDTNQISPKSVDVNLLRLIVIAKLLKKIIIDKRDY
jgi:hypothetical protein